MRRRNDLTLPEAARNVCRGAGAWPMWLVFGTPVRWTTCMVFPGLLLLSANLAWIGHCLAISSARFRDIPLIVGTILQLAIFATPVMWPVSALGPLEWVAQVNPFYH